MVSLAFTYADLEFFLLLVVRVTCFIYSAPFFTLNGFPRQVKIGLGVMIAFLLYGVVDRPVLVYDSLIGYSVIVMKEAVTGFLIGFGAQLCTYITTFAGHMIDVETGMSMAQVFDVNTRENVSITSTLYQYAFFLMLLVSGALEYLLRAIADSYQLIPVNGAVIDTSKLMESMITFMGTYITIGFRICLPVFCAIILLNSILGVMAKTAPQMNMFSVGMQLKVLTGFAVLFLTVSMLPYAADMIYTAMKRMIVMFVEDLM